jgi:hypothetical protein
LVGAGAVSKIIMSLGSARSSISDNQRRSINDKEDHNPLLLPFVGVFGLSGEKGTLLIVDWKSENAFRKWPSSSVPLVVDHTAEMRHVFCFGSP